MRYATITLIEDTFKESAGWKKELGPVINNIQYYYLETYNNILTFDEIKK